VPFESIPVKTQRTAVSLLLPILALGLLASLSPATIIVFILVLATTRARVNAVAFLVGWGVSLTIVFAAAYAIGGTHAAQQGDGRIGVELVETVLGVVLAVAGVQRWQRRNTPRPSSGASKALATRLRQLRPSEATILGVIKEPWTLTAAAALVVAHYHTGIVVALLAFVVFTVISTATVGLTFWYHSSHPTEAEARLSVVKDRLVRASPATFAAVSLAVGLYLAIDGIIGLLNS
jgi:Sap, sulfolipid-1-addressing protein